MAVNAVALLKAVGVESDTVSTRASAAISSRPSTSGDSVSTPQFSAAGLNVIKTAQATADEFGDDFVSTERLLLGAAADTVMELDHVIDVHGLQASSVATAPASEGPLCGDGQLTPRVSSCSMARRIQLDADRSSAARLRTSTRVSSGSRTGTGLLAWRDGEPVALGLPGCPGCIVGVFLALGPFCRVSGGATCWLIWSFDAYASLLLNE